MRRSLALVTAIVVAWSAFEGLAGDSGWRMAAALLAGGALGALAYTAVLDGGRNLWAALRHGSRPSGSTHEH